MNAYDLIIIGQDPVAELVLEQVAPRFSRVLWICQSQPEKLPVEIARQGQHAEKIELLIGTYRFDSENVVAVIPTSTKPISASSNSARPTEQPIEKQPEEILVTSNRIVLACGATPLRPAWMLNHPRVYFSDQWKSIPEPSPRVAVIGLGKTGEKQVLQLQNQFVEIYGLDRRPRSQTPFFQEQSPQQSLKQRAEKQKTDLSRASLVFENGVIGLDASADRLRIYLEDGQILSVEAAIVCCGYKGNLTQQQVRQAGLSLDDCNRLWCNTDFETWTPGIFAIGQIVGYPESASTTAEQLEQVEKLVQTLTQPLSARLLA